MVFVSIINDVEDIADLKVNPGSFGSETFEDIGDIQCSC